MLYGYRIIDDLLDGLSHFVRAQSFADIQSVVGASLQYLVPHQKLSRDYKEVPIIDLSTCVHCGNCFVACRDGGYQAITFGADRTPNVDLGRCVGCGLCEQVCPVLECIRMRPALPETDVS
jgi:dihydropyrimidine dehydrogenase (NAD+) subunit PreA